MSLPLSPSVYAAIFAEAARAWPNEACGVIVGPVNDPEEQRFVPFDNLQDRLHSMDPESHPRDARTAYAMDAFRLDRLIREAESRGEALIAVVHSHPQHPAYFSNTDRAAATSPFGGPTWPEAAQLVVSVYEREVRELRAFAWDGADWPERPLSGLPPLPGPPPGARILGDV